MIHYAYIVDSYGMTGKWIFYLHVSLIKPRSLGTIVTDKRDMSARENSSGTIVLLQSRLRSI